MPLPPGSPEAAPHRYALGGFQVLSAVRFPSVPELEADHGAPRLELRLPRIPGDALDPAPDERWVAEHRRPDEDDPYLRVARGSRGHRLVHRDGVELLLTDPRTLVLTHLDPSASTELIEHLFLDQLLPLVMSRLGRVSLHASGVAWEGRAVAFLASSGVGKSTSAACAVARHGASFLADDQVVLERRAGTWLVHPSYPSVRLLADAAATYFARPPGPTRKQRVPLVGSRAPAQLAAIVLLERGPVRLLARLRGKDALVGVAQHVDRLDPGDRDALRAELGGLVALVETVTVSRAVVPGDPTELEALIAEVRELAMSEPITSARATYRGR